MMKRAVIFDMDGVLINSEPIYFAVEQNLYHELRLPISKSEHDTFVGMSMQKIWSYLKTKYKLPESLNDLIKLHIKRMIEQIDQTTHLNPTPFVSEFIDKLQDKDWEVAVATSTVRTLATKILTRIDLINRFDTMVCGDEIKKGKPEPDIFLKTADLLRLNPSQCIVIEDSTNGVCAAKKAGMNCIGFRNISSGNQNLSQSDLVINCFSELDIKVLETML